MKKSLSTLLALSLSATLLAACGTEEEQSAQSDTKTEETAESATTEKSTEDTTESADTTESSDNTAESETVEEETQESANEPEGRSITEGFTTSMDSVNIELTDGKVYETTLEMDAHYADAVAGDTVTMIELNYDMENTEDIARALHLDQAEIVTNTGEQVRSELFMVGGLVTDMKGAVKSSGDVVYVLKNTAVEELEWIDVFIPYPIGDGIEFAANDPEEHRIEFE